MNEKITEGSPTNQETNQETKKAAEQKEEKMMDIPEIGTKVTYNGQEAIIINRQWQKFNLPTEGLIRILSTGQEIWVRVCPKCKNVLVQSTTADGQSLPPREALCSPCTAASKIEFDKNKAKHEEWLRAERKKKEETARWNAAKFKK